MDKLQPVLKHKFWICFGIAILMLMIGWKMGSGALATTYEERSATLNTAFSNATLGGQASSKPNKSWIEKAKVYNDEDQIEFDQSAMKLWKRQVDGGDLAGQSGEPVRFWPRGMQERMQGIPYRGSVPVTTHREIYARRYQAHVMEQLDVVKPFDFQTGEGLVLISEDRIPHVTFGIWKNRPPSWTDMWNAQEDVWLTRALLETVARVNEGATRIDKAPIREIVQIYLRGGVRAEGEEISASGSSGADSDADQFGAGGGFGSRMGFGGGLGASGPGANSFYSSFYYSDAEEFGEDKNAPSGGLGGGFGGFGGKNMSSGGMGMDESETTKTDSADAVEDRYVDKDESLPYVTRAFRLHLKMEQDAVPILLAELTNSNWPIEIVRVHMKSVHYAAGTGGLGDGGYGDSDMGEDMSEGGFGGAPGMGGGGKGGMGSGGMSSGMGGGGMSSGMGGGGMSSGMGGGGMMEGAMGGAMGRIMPGSGGMMGGQMTGRGGMSSGMSSGVAGTGSIPNPKANLVASAMNDPFIVEVLVSGLMTLYRSREEADAAEKTEQQDAAEEAANPTPPDAAAGEPSTEDPGMQPDGENPADAAEDGVPPADADAGLSDPTGTDSETPGEATTVPPEEGSPPSNAPPATESETPNSGTTPPDDASESTETPGDTVEEPVGATP